jgi:hypothetical protein
MAAVSDPPMAHRPALDTRLPTPHTRSETTGSGPIGEARPGDVSEDGHISRAHPPAPAKTTPRPSRVKTVGLPILAAMLILGGIAEIFAAPSAGNQAKASIQATVPVMLDDPMSYRVSVIATPTISVLRQTTTPTPSLSITHPGTATVAPAPPHAPISNQVIATAPPAASVLTVLRQTTTQALPSFLITYYPVSVTTVPTISAATAAAACTDHVAECPAGPLDTATLASIVTNRFPTPTPPTLVWELQWNNATCRAAVGPALPSGSTLASYTCTIDIDIDAATGLYVDEYSY